MEGLRPLPPALAKKAAEELNEDPEQVRYYLDALKDWLKCQPHLKARTYDQFLIAFLRSAKFSLEKAKQRVTNYYTYRAAMPELFHNRDLSDPKIEFIIKSGMILYLPEPVSPDGPRVAMLRPGLFDLNKHTIFDVCKVGAMGTELLLYEDDNAIVAGFVLIMDLGNISKQTMMSFDPVFVKKLTVMANKMNPTRMKGFHFLNVPPVFEKLFSLVKGVINAKLRDRFYVHGSNYEALEQHMPKHILPIEYGGTVDVKELQEAMWNRLMEHTDFVKEEETFGLQGDCAKAHKVKEVISEEIYGLQGSFRQLNVD